MKILLVASEAVPLAKVGGLADVAGALPKALATLGHDARLLMPQYTGLNTRFTLRPEITDLQVEGLYQPETVDLNQTNVDEVPVYTLASPVFGTSDVYTNDLERFYFFSRAVFEILPHLSWQPDVIHCHDWMSALVVYWSRQAGYPYHSLFTIHNLNFQGRFDHHSLIESQLRDKWDAAPAGVSPVPHCFIAQAILQADEINTVSETYSREITTPEHGVGLDRLLRFRREHLHGILNGIDSEVWNPAGDSFLRYSYDSSTLELKTRNKTALQQETGLPVDPAVPLVGMVQRLDEQKGLDIFLEGIDRYLSGTPVQIVLQGKGRSDYQERLSRLAESFRGKFVFIPAYDEPLAHRIYAGCDLFLMPSRFEPCGLGQMIAMRYGALPVVRHTGGLVDSVPAFNPALSRGNGFVFHDYTPQALFNTLDKALEAYNNRKLWYAARERVSRLDLSWAVSAGRYEQLYRASLKNPH